MIILYLLILLLNTIIIFLIKNKLIALKIISIIFFFSGALIILTGYISGIIIRTKIDIINTNKITNILFNNFLTNSLIFISLSIVLYITYKILKHKNNKITTSKS